MGFFDKFKRKAREPGAAMGMVGQHLAVISGPAHPDHYDRERNAARIEQLQTAIAQFEAQGVNPKTAELQAELDKQLKIRELFHAGKEA